MREPSAAVCRHELSPVQFLERAGTVYADRVAVVDGDVSYTWRDFRSRAGRFASALRASGFRTGDRIAFLALNSEPLLLAHFNAWNIVPGRPGLPRGRTFARIVAGLK